MIKTPYVFKDRTEAGKLLAEELITYAKEKPLVLALPRGGVPVAYEIAQELNAPLDTIVVRKIGAPKNPEFGVGAIAPGDILIIDNNARQSVGASLDDLDPIVNSEMQEMERRMMHFNSGAYSKDSKADFVILVDDGLATGVTARAAIESVKMNLKPQKIIFAAPVCAKDTADLLRNLVILVTLQEVENLTAIGEWYEDFTQVSDDEVLHCLEASV